MSTTMNQDPYEAVTPDTNDNWINGPDAVTPNEALDAAAGTDGFVDPYTVAAPDGSDNWINGPDAVQENEALDGLATSAAELAQTTGNEAGFSIGQLFDGSLPVQDWINDGLDWFVERFRPLFQTLREPVDAILGGVEAALQFPPAWAMIMLLALLAWQLAGARLAIGTLVSLFVIAILGIWSEAMVTLSLVLTSLFFCIVLGLPLGIWLANSDRAERIIRPILDAMQTTPAFVYLVPVVMLFGIGNVPGVIVTIIFALAPLVRLTSLGIRQVRPDLIEAARAYGASPWQMLTKVQMPLAMPSIMAGINQSLMLSLSMVVIASMIAVGGLGLMVLRGIGRLDMGLATVGGIGIVILAILLDRVTQAMGQQDRHGLRWHQRGPVGLLNRLLQRQPARPAATATPATPATARA
ncbi:MULTISPECIES: glycine betaine/L-proline ABC transporter permease ProW [Brachymonas]|uniref:glycine betaine/L-proline ABC transporter permease ProW n=1 Tax=Brachymonas TaxID=28219 RepID=UPI002E79D17D|nr:glycine betaine/L-proline ABC transporter permease ProW [Brachymonas sp. J145]MEE1652432.1 glycine betaine/L-proline ABC transporter permease ProW [Brachymonas sp. J145]